jgi:hypothetical protein
VSEVKRTVCIASDGGAQLAVYPYHMKLVKAGAEFYVGQQPFTVVRTQLNGEELIVELKSKNGSDT